MKTLVVASVVCLSLFTVPPVLSQDQPVREPAAVATIELVVGAMGGRAAISQMQDCVAEGTTEAPEKSWAANGRFVWKNSGREFRYENPDRDGGTQVFVSGHGSPGIVKGGEVRRMKAHSALASFPAHLVAALLLASLTNDAFEIQMLDAATIAGRRALVVQTSLGSRKLISVLTTRRWYVDVATGVPLRIEYATPALNDASVVAWQTVDLGDYRSVSGVLVPFTITLSTDGKPAARFVLDSVTFHAGTSASEFDLPAGGAQ